MTSSFLCNKSKIVLSQVRYINNVPVRVCARRRCKDTTVQRASSSLASIRILKRDVKKRWNINKQAEVWQTKIFYLFFHTHFFSGERLGIFFPEFNIQRTANVGMRLLSFMFYLLGLYAYGMNTFFTPIVAPSVVRNIYIPRARSRSFILSPPIDFCSTPDRL